MLAHEPAGEEKVQRVDDQEPPEWIRDRYTGLDISEITKENSKVIEDTDTASKVIQMALKQPPLTAQSEAGTHQLHKQTPRYGVERENEDLVKYSDCAEDKQVKKGYQESVGVPNNHRELRRVPSRYDEDQKENRNNQLPLDWPDLKKVLQVKDYGYSKPESKDSQSYEPERSQVPKLGFAREESRNVRPQTHGRGDDSVHIGGLSKDLASEVFPSLNNMHKGSGNLRRIESHPSPIEEHQHRMFKPSSQGIHVNKSHQAETAASSGMSGYVQQPTPYNKHHREIDDFQGGPNTNFYRETHMGHQKQQKVVHPSNPGPPLQQRSQESTFSQAYIDSLIDLHK